MLWKIELDTSKTPKEKKSVQVILQEARQTLAAAKGFHAVNGEAVAFNRPRKVKAFSFAHFDQPNGSHIFQPPAGFAILHIFTDSDFDWSHAGKVIVIKHSHPVGNVCFATHTCEVIWPEEASIVGEQGELFHESIRPILEF